MKVTVTTLSDEIFNLDVSEDLELENFKAFCEIESGVPSREFIIVHEGRPLLEDGKTLKQYGIKEGDVLLIQHMMAASRQPSASPNIPQIDFGSIAVPGASTASSSAEQHAIRPVAGVQPGLTQQEQEDPVFIRDMLLANPDQLAVLKVNNPRLADALNSGDIEKFKEILQEQQKDRSERERMKIRMINAGPFDVEAQRLIADEIRLKNIESNMEAAIEYNPESFGQVIMLYIHCLVNGSPVKAFIDSGGFLNRQYADDKMERFQNVGLALTSCLATPNCVVLLSGAQTTIMSQACAERCNIMRLVDNRWAGVAKGVGMQKIIGRVHLGQIQIENDFLTSSFSILEDQPMDMLLGLDMLRRHQCSIDLRRNKLVIGTTGTETPFLSESDVPDCARLSMNPEVLHRSVQEEEDKHLAQAMHRSAEEARAASSGDRFSEADITALVQMGFPREQVVEELRKCNGDTMQATAALFAKSLKF